MFIDGNRIDEFLTSGREADGYADTEEKLKKLKKSFPQTKYLYVYKPIKDSLHKTTAYVAADISMQEILEDDASFFSKFFSLFFSLSLIIMSIIVELVKSGIVRPINRMAYASSQFAYNLGTDKDKGLEILSTLDIHSQDEIKHLHTALLKMGNESLDYIKQLQEQTERITRMQDEIIEMSHFHHEKWNGSGYPNRISGEDIPLSARIMAVADVFDALVAERIYQKPFTYEKAMEIITEGAGKHFDPVVVKAFCQISKRLYDERTKLDQEGQVL